MFEIMANLCFISNYLFDYSTYLFDYKYYSEPFQLIIKGLAIGSDRSDTTFQSAITTITNSTNTTTTISKKQQHDERCQPPVALAWAAGNPQEPQASEDAAQGGRVSRMP